MAAEVRAVIRLVGALGLVGCTATNPSIPQGSTDTGDPDGSSNAEASTTATSATATTTTTTTADPDTTEATTDDTTTTVDDGCPAATHACVDAAPTGWTGPVAVIRDANGRPAPACAAPFDAGEPALAYAELDAPPAECSCTCSPVDGHCSSVELRLDDDATCTSRVAFGDIVFGPACQATSDFPISWMAATPPPIDDGACVAEDSSEVPPASFGARHTLCPATLVDDPAACEPGLVCAPVPADPFEGELCIWSSGDLPCPTELGWGARELVHEDIEDSRGCTGCACDEIGGTCTGQVQLWSGPSCNGTMLATIDFGGACEQVDAVAGSASVVSLVQEGSCAAPSGGQPAGQAVLADPITLCCRG